MGRIWLGFLLLMCGVGWGQRPRAVPVRGPAAVASTVMPAAAAVVLRGLAARSGVIFAGHVVEVRRNDGAGFVDVVFAIDDAVRGCEGSKRYVLREWAGLWAEEPQRYGVGQRLLMLLAARGPSGMSAPVGGMAGRIPLVGVRQGPLANGSRVSGDEGEGTEDAVDLRWVEAAAVRGGAGGEKARTEAAKGAGSGWIGPVEPMEAPVVVAGPGLSAVLAVLGGR